MNFRTLIAAAAIAALSGCSEKAADPAADSAPAATPEGFTTDYDGALERAASRGVHTLVLFTGSDWCCWCQKLEEEVLSKPEFVAKAKELYELVYCDFPSEKKLPEEIAARNKKLEEKYKVEGFPTVVVLDKTGQKVATLGYREGGPEKWLEYAEKEIAISGVVEKHFKPFDEEFGRLDDESFAAFEKAREAIKNEGDKIKRIETAKKLMAGPLAKMKDFRKRLAEAEMPQELAEKKSDLLDAVDHVIHALENEP